MSLQGRHGCLVQRGADQQSALQLWQVDGKSHLWHVASLQGLGCDFWWPKNCIFFVLFFGLGIFEGEKVLRFFSFFWEERSPAFSGGFISFIPWISRHVRGVSRKSAAEARATATKTNIRPGRLVGIKHQAWEAAQRRPSPMEQAAIKVAKVTPKWLSEARAFGSFW